MNRRLRLIAVLTVLGGGALALIGSTQTWLVVALREGGREPLTVPGADAVAMLAALSLAALALGLALTIVGRVLRYLFGLLALAIAGTLLVASWRVAAEQPIDAYMSTVAEATGLTGAQAVGELVDTVAVTPWPVITIGAALLVAVGGVLTLATAHLWSRTGRRYRTDAAIVASSEGSRPHDAIDSWDDLSRGEDPTDR